MVPTHPLPTDSSLPTLQSLTISRLTPGTRSTEDLQRRYFFASCCNHFGATFARRLLRLIALTARSTTGGLCIQGRSVSLDECNLSINEYLDIVLFYQSKFPIASTGLFVNFAASFVQIRAKARSDGTQIGFEGVRGR
jgi:hypothetical protein